MIKVKIKDIIKTIIFILFITFIIWNRLFREFSTKIINEYIFNIYGVILFLYLICMALARIVKYNISFQNSTGYFSLLYNTFITYFLKVYEPLLYYISINIDLKKLLEIPISYIVAYVNYPQILAFFFTKVPSIFLATLFFLEVLSYNKLEYFFKSLPALIIPLLFNACLFIIDEISLAQIEYVTPHLTCESKGNILVFQLAPESPNIPNALSLAIMQKSLTWLVNQYQIFSAIKYFCDDINKAKEFFGPWVLLYTSLLYFISWFYILTVILDF